MQQRIAGIEGGGLFLAEDVIEVKTEKTREFRVKFDDGLSGLIVIDRSFCSGVFKALLDDDRVLAAYLGA